MSESPLPDEPLVAAAATDEPDPPITAHDRVQSGRARRRRSIPFTDTAGARGAFWRAVGVVLVLAALTGAGVWWLQRDTSTDADLLSRLADVSADYQPALLTVNAAQAERYVEETSGWLISAPELPALQLVGVGFADLSPEASVPAFRYDGSDGETAVVYAYDYVFLDSIRGQFVLPEAVYAGLAEDDPVDTRRLGDAYFVSWRERAVVFTAVTTDQTTFERIGVGVQSAE